MTVRARGLPGARMILDFDVLSCVRACLRPCAGVLLWHPDLFFSLSGRLSHLFKKCHFTYFQYFLTNI